MKWDDRKSMNEQFEGSLTGVIVGQARKRKIRINGLKMRIGTCLNMSHESPAQEPPCQLHNTITSSLLHLLQPFQVNNQLTAFPNHVFGGVSSWVTSSSVGMLLNMSSSSGLRWRGFLTM